jgi:uncharacterized protein (TIGR02145 family)
MKKNSTIFPLVLALLSLGATSIQLTAQTAIGGINPDGSAMLDVQSTSKGVLFPRLTTTQRDAISPAATGLMIFNTSSRCLEINLGTGTANWQKVKCTSCGAYVASGVWKEFMCHNLGANTDVDPFTPSADLNGNYYQWGRSTIAANAPPSDAIVGSWNGTDANDGSWVDNTKTGSDPCPDGYRVPTIAQWTGVRNFNQQTASGINWTAGASNFSTGRFFGPALFLPATGSRSNSDGALSDRGRFGNYWSSTQVDGTAVSYYLNFWSSGSGSSNDSQRAFGYPVRCIAE